MENMNYDHCLDSIHFNQTQTFESGVFPFYKTKNMKSARKCMEESQNNSFNNLHNFNNFEKDQNSVSNDIKPLTNVQTITPTEKSSEFTPLKDAELMNFSESLKSQNEKTKVYELDFAKSETLLKKLEILENALNESRMQNHKYKKDIEEHLAIENKLKAHVQNMLDVNDKLTMRIKEKELKQNILNEDQGFNNKILTNSNSSNNNGVKIVEKLEKQLKDSNDEMDYLHEKIMNLNQKLEQLMKKDIYKEKMLDFYKNRIKLYQFKLENYPKSEKEQIQYLEEYIMALLGENSKLNKALEKSETESRKWQEKYFDYEKTKEVLVTHDSSNRDKINDVAKKEYNANNIHEKDSSASKKDSLFWGCHPKRNY